MRQGRLPLARFIIIVGSLLYCSLAAAVDPALSWRSIESEHFQLHFAEPHQLIAERAIAIAERAHQRLAQELDWTPAEPTHLVISDESDFANGFATVFNINRSVLYLAPPTGVAGLEDFDDWLDLLITHEYTHILHMDKVAGAPAHMRSVFGRFLLLFPNVFQPTWMLEGLATYKETDQQRGIGRGQSRLFQMLMRMEVDQGIKPLAQVNLPISTWPAGATRYLYGVYFMRFISERYGEARLEQLIAEYSDNILPFFINTTFTKVFAKDLTAIWQEYEQWLDEQFGPQLAELKLLSNPDDAIAVSATAYVTQPVRALGKDVYYIRSDGSYQPELVRQNAVGDIEVLTELHFNAGFDLNTRGEIIISQPEVCAEYNLYSDLYLYRNNELKRISHCGRYQRAIWSSDGESLFAVHHAAGRFELRELDSEGSVKRLLWKSTDESVLGYMDASPDGEHIVASLWRKGTGWNLEIFNIASGSWSPLTQNTVIQAYPEYSVDGKSIFYSSEADAVYNLYRYDLASGQHHQLSHLLGGGFQSSQGEVDGPLYYIGYSARGTGVYMLEQADKHNVVSLQQSEKLNAASLELQSYTSRDYSPWQSLRPRWWLPALNVTKDRNEVGFTTAGNDALGLHNYALSAGYDFKNSQPLGSVVYQYSNRFVVSLDRENNLFRNNLGLIDRIRANEDLQLIYALPDSKILALSSLLFALSWERDRDVELSNGATSANEFNNNLAGLAWLYNNSRRYPFSISANDGRRIRLVAEDSDLFNSDFSGEIYTVDWREYLRLGGEHVLALRVLQGWGTEQPVRFRLGGEANGRRLSPFLETSGEGVFARREYALRGYAEGLPQLSGRRAQLVSAEYRFPLQRVERGFMAPPLGLMQWYGNAFIESGAAYDGRRAQQYYSSAGIEFSADLVAFYQLPLNLRLGYAHGFASIGDDRVYLTIGASF